MEVKAKLDPDLVSMFEEIKKEYKLKNNSETVRSIIRNEHERLFPKKRK